MNREIQQAHAGGSGSQHDLVDAIVVRDLCDGCGWTVAEFAEYYLPRALQELAELDAAYRANDSAGVLRLAHGAAGSSSSAGMTALTALYRRIEQSARAGEADATERLLKEAPARIEAGVAALRNLVGPK